MENENKISTSDREALKKFNPKLIQIYKSTGNSDLVSHVLSGQSETDWILTNCPETYGTPPEIAHAAVSLHDIGHTLIRNKKHHHAIGAIASFQLLTVAGVSDKTNLQISSAVLRHRCIKKRKPITVLDKIVSSADGLSHVTQFIQVTPSTPPTDNYWNRKWEKQLQKDVPLKGIEQKTRKKLKRCLKKQHFPDSRLRAKIGYDTVVANLKGFIADKKDS